MQHLEIFDFEGRQDASSAQQLHLALSRRSDGGNHFEIAAFGRPYPMLDLMVSGDLAVVHYFAAEDNAGAQSITDLGDAAKTVEFPENRAGATFTMPASAVVCMTTAIRCAEELSIDLQRPTAVTWFELEADSVRRKTPILRRSGVSALVERGCHWSAMSGLGIRRGLGLVEHVGGGCCSGDVGESRQL
jgi:hypothetical protein